MILEYYRQLLAVAIILLMFGCIAPFFMAIHIVESTLFLNFLSFGASVLGLFLGVAGISGARVSQKHRIDKDNQYK